MPLGVEAGLGPGDFVLDGDAAPTPSQKEDTVPDFGHVYCHQTAIWINMPLGREVGFGPRDIMLDGDPVLP